MKKFGFLLLFSFFTFIIEAQNQSWAIISSNINFKIKNAGFHINGTLSGLTGIIYFDVAKNSGNKIETSIDANTINTGNNTRDEHLKKEEYFSANKFPKISMSTATITKEADGKFKGMFTLTIKGISKIVPILFTYTEKEGKSKFAGSFTINRLDYGVGSSSFILSDNVTITLDVSCIKK